MKLREVGDREEGVVEGKLDSPRSQWPRVGSHRPAGWGAARAKVEKRDQKSHKLLEKPLTATSHPFLPPSAEP